jgi:hypothetical protein
MPAERHPFHMHTLDEVDIACRIWGAAGVRAVLGTPEPHSVRSLPTLAVAEPRPAPQHPKRERAGIGWLRLRRAPHAAVR